MYVLFFIRSKSQINKQLETVGPNIGAQFRFLGFHNRDNKNLANIPMKKNGHVFVKNSNTLCMQA